MKLQLGAKLMSKSYSLVTDGVGRASTLWFFDVSRGFLVVFSSFSRFFQSPLQVLIALVYRSPRLCIAISSTYNAILSVLVSCEFPVLWTFSYTIIFAAYDRSIVSVLFRYF